MSRSRWVTPSIVASALVAAASILVLVQGSSGTASLHHEHHASALSADLPEGVALHGIAPVEPLRTEQVDALLSGTGSSPRALTVDADGKLWTLGSDGSLAVAGIGGARLRISGSPTDIEAIGNLLYVSEMDRDLVVVIDPRSDEVIDRIPVPTGPVALHAAGGRLWVASVTDGILSSIDLEEGRVDRSIEVGFGPIALADDGERLAVVSALDRRVLLVDMVSLRILSSTPVGAGASDASFAHGRLWVSSSSSGEVAILDPRTGDVTATLAIDAEAEPGLGPARLIPSSHGVLVVNGRHRSVQRIDTDLTVHERVFFGSVGASTPSTFDALMYRGALVIADLDAGVLARFAEGVL